MMHWQVKGSSGSLEIEADMLIQEFLARKEVSEEHKYISQALVELLARGKVLSTYSISELATLATFVGYYYRMFIEQNEVEVIHVDSSENHGNETSQ